MEAYNCTAPSSLYTNNICIDNDIAKLANKFYSKMYLKRFGIKECKLPCEFTKIKIMSKEAYKTEGNNMVNLNFDKFIKVTRSYNSYTGLELMAELGGYVGLFLGISVFHLSKAFKSFWKAIYKL